MSLVQEPGLSDFLDTRRVDLVIDVGANAGQFARDLRSLGYRGRIHSFEPLPTAFAELQSVAASDPLWEMSNVGVGRKAGKLEINIDKSFTLADASRAQAYSRAGHAEGKIILLVDAAHAERK